MRINTQGRISVTTPTQRDQGHISPEKCYTEEPAVALKLNRTIGASDHPSACVPLVTSTPNRL